MVRERIPYHGIVHGGGDKVILVRFAEAVAKEDPGLLLTPAKDCLESHLVCFAAEKARIENRVVEMEEFRNESRQEADAL